MKLITILLGLFLDRYVGTLEDYRQLGWYGRYVGWFSSVLGALGKGAVGIVFVLLPPLAVLLVVSTLVDDVMLGLFEIVVGVVVLLFALGPKSLEEQTDAYVEAEARGDAERRDRVAAELLGTEPPQDQGPRTRALIETIFVQANVRQFAVLFWFVVLGPVGAALYRLSSLLTGPEEGYAALRPAATRWLALLDWAPARLCALGYALTGRFEDSLPILRQYFFTRGGDMAAANAALLKQVGAESINLDEELGEELDATGVSLLIETAMNLLTRTLIVWVTVVAIMTIGGWMG